VHCTPTRKAFVRNSSNGPAQCLQLKRPADHRPTPGRCLIVQGLLIWRQSSGLSKRTKRAIGFEPEHFQRQDGSSDWEVIFAM